uniref:Uncharacterized protein n=1 Tax=Arundo donax TaxID=35708 RepID=A0A0A9HE25_ARUDO
MSGRVIPR